MLEASRLLLCLLHIGTALLVDDVYCTSYTTYTEMNSLKDHLNVNSALTVSTYEKTNAIRCGRLCHRNAECSTVQSNELSQKCQLLQSAPVANITGQDTGWRTYSKTCKIGYRDDSGLCFKLYDVNRSVDDAKSICAEDGGRLLRIQSQKQQDIVAGYLGTINCQCSPTVAGRLLSGVWAWEDGTAMEYFNWAKSPDDTQPCIKLWQSDGHSWETTSCSRVKPFLCEIKTQ